MHTTVRRYEGVADTDEVVRRVNESFLDVLRGVQGYVNYSIIDAGGGTVVTISTFEDRSGAEESDRRAAEWIQQQDLSSLLPNRPQITVGEVVVHKGR